MQTKYLLVVTITLLISACTAADIKISVSPLGQHASLDELLAVANLPGPIKFKKHIAADWSVPLSGLLNLDHPKAVKAGLQDRDEAIQLFVYTLEHPSKGTFLVDSGISERFRDGADNPDISYIVENAMNTSALKVRLTTKDLEKQLNGIDGVFLSHIHLDHIMGLTDLNNIPVYIGPAETESRLFTHLFTRGTTNRLLAMVSVLYEWQFNHDGIIDVFGDGSLWAIHSPGHTPGSTAYLARSTTGPQLMIGDVTHTRWGWDHQDEPGTFTKDGVQNATSLGKLNSLVEKALGLVVHPGHQK